MQLTGPFDVELLSVLPKTLKYICHNGAGYDNIDIPACSENGAFYYLSWSHLSTGQGTG